jgi:integrase
LNGEDYRKTLKTRDWQRAIRIAEQLERPNIERADLVPCEQQGCRVRVEHGRCDKHRRTLSKAIEAYFTENADLEHGTLRNYRRALKFLQSHFSQDPDVHDIERQKIAEYRSVRNIAASTWTKELEIIRAFFRFCVSNKWTNSSPAAEVKIPKNLKPTDKEPYEPNDIIKILAACDVIGQRPYERLRARAMSLLLRYTALRIGDVALLAKDRIRNGEIYLRTLKNGKVVKLPVQPELKAALLYKYGGTSGRLRPAGDMPHSAVEESTQCREYRSEPRHLPSNSWQQSRETGKKQHAHLPPNTQSGA